MKEWNCNDFVVDNSTKAAHPAHPPRNLSPRNLQNSVPGKHEPQRDKTLFNLLSEDEVAKSETNSGKEFSQGILRYEISTDFDIDDWHCKETMENSAKIVYAVRDDEQNKNSKGNLLTNTNPQIPQTSNPNELNPIRINSMPDEWRQILQEGLLNETRIKLRRKYPLGENSDTLEARSLAPDVKAALPEISVEKDQYHFEMQDQLGTGISAIVSALSSLRENTSTKKLDEVVESLVDAGKIFTNLHYLHTTSRKSLLIGEFNGTDQVSSQGNPGASKHVARNQKSQHSQFPSHRGLRSQTRDENIVNVNNYGNNTKTKDTQNINSTNETTSQRVKRLLCGISDEEYRSSKKQREDPDNGQNGFPGIVEILKQARALHGVHEELLLSWPCNASAVKHYQKPIKLWWDYCQRESINVFDVSLSPLKSFFLEIAQEPKSYETLNLYKTAILLLTPEKLEKDRLFTEFLKGISSDYRKT
ncbi:uncharacterized protein [Venturia canescens]|uniref:uncharacterized protein n=1 Tax=Venturia canescens TaxID=32260 RepID=UPI001C9C1ED8|nr:uncharacterized protein LOC122417555 [Venturia canescens]